jgi:hypothetical protein
VATSEQILGVAAVARMTYEPVTKITDELLAMRWRTESQCRMWFSRRNAAPGRLGLTIVPDGEEFRVEPKGGSKISKPAGFSQEYEIWALEVDQLLLDANEPAETEATLEALFAQKLTAPNAAQRIINRRAQELDIAAAPAPKLPPPAVVGDTLADQAAAPHADSKPQIAGANEVVLQIITTDDMAPIVARRLAQITGASIAWAGNRVSVPESDRR